MKHIINRIYIRLKLLEKTMLTQHTGQQIATKLEPHHQGNNEV